MVQSGDHCYFTLKYILIYFWLHQTPVGTHRLLSRCGTRAHGIWVACAVWGLSSLIRGASHIPYSAEWFLNHRTTMEVPWRPHLWLGLRGGWGADSQKEDVQRVEKRYLSGTTFNSGSFLKWFLQVFQVLCCYISLLFLNLTIPLPVGLGKNVSLYFLITTVV